MLQFDSSTMLFLRASATPSSSSGMPSAVPAFLRTPWSPACNIVVNGNGHGCCWLCRIWAARPAWRGLGALQLWQTHLIVQEAVAPLQASSASETWMYSSVSRDVKSNTNPLICNLRFYEAVHAELSASFRKAPVTNTSRWVRSTGDQSRILACPEALGKWRRKWLMTFKTQNRLPTRSWRILQGVWPTFFRKK